MVEEQRTIHFKSLDALRFFAFFAVFLHHSFFTDNPELRNNPVFKGITHVVKHGELGVSFFFVLSGFLITYLLLAEEKQTGRIDILAFYTRRVLRIWPLYFACVAAGFLLLPIAKRLIGLPPEPQPNPLWFATFLVNFNRIYNGPPDSVLGVLWSVAIEEQFYLFWPLLLTLWRFPRWHLFAVILLGSLCYRLVWRDDEVRLYYHTLAVISDMALGGLVAWASYHSLAFRTATARFSAPLLAGIYLLGFLLILNRATLFADPLARPFERLVTGAFFAFVIIEQSFGRDGWWRVDRLRLLSHWGKYTYGLYCLHFWAINTSVILTKKAGLTKDFFGVMIVQTGISFALAIGLAWISYEAYEKPFLRLKQRFARNTLP